MRNLPPDLATRLQGRDVIVFDGVCVLCSAFYRFVLRFDRQARFCFATAQSPLGQALYRGLDLPTARFETNLVILDGQVHTHLDSLAAVAGRLGGIWRVLVPLRWLPVFIKTPLYLLVARNRYRLFGRKDHCMIPDAAMRARFLETAPPEG